ncbi:MAG: aminotransferase class III-fold pyridoxal phosphate-dependent enzyme [Pseudomonadota bacterium]
MEVFWSLVLVAITVLVLRRVGVRLQLSRAKHPSLRGHARMAQRIARLVPFHGYDEREFFESDGAPANVAEQRRSAFYALAERLRLRSPRTLEKASEIAVGVSDGQFTSRYRVPFQYRELVRRTLKTPAVVEASAGVRVRDLDGNWYDDLTGAYGVNLFGYDFYKACMARGSELAGELGPVLGPQHPVVADNVRRLRELSGLDEVSFHMSGTEAVMQAVRLARYHTRRSHVVRFCGAYHGWWGAVQPGVGNPRPERETYTLNDLDAQSLHVIRTRRDIACVLVNPLQAIHPNANAPGDGALLTSDRSAGYDRERYTAWLRELRAACSENGVVLILDEVFLGFRLDPRGAQAYFGVEADMVTWGKTLGGGYPVGVLCGRADLMRRFREDRPADICFARGTFNAHPHVMGAMNAFLERLADPAIAATYEGLDERWDARAALINQRMAAAGLPVRVANMISVFTTYYVAPSRYNWMYQYYLSDRGLLLSWVGTGRFIFSHNYSDEDFDRVVEKMVLAATRMASDGWWWQGPALTNRAIKRRIARELLRARLGGRRRAGDERANAGRSVAT